MPSLGGITLVDAASLVLPRSNRDLPTERLQECGDIEDIGAKHGDLVSTLSIDKYAILMPTGSPSRFMPQAVMAIRLLHQQSVISLEILESPFF